MFPKRGFDQLFCCCSLQPQAASSVVRAYLLPGFPHDSKVALGSYQGHMLSQVHFQAV